jgi:hypothetical protein
MPNSDSDIQFLTVEQLKAASLGDEIYRAASLVELGLKLVRKLKSGNSDVYPPFFLLTNGFERLIKVALVVTILDTEGSYPGSNEWRQYKGHAIRVLLEGLESRLASPSKSVAWVLTRAKDNDSRLGRLLAILDSHAVARSGRYFNFDFILGKTKSFGEPPPPDMWTDLTFDRILDIHAEDGEELTDAQVEAANVVAVNELADELGWLAWAIAASISHIDLGDDFGHFGRLPERLERFLQMRPPLGPTAT